VRETRIRRQTTAPALIISVRLLYYGEEDRREGAGARERHVRRETRRRRQTTSSALIISVRLLLWGGGLRRE
jgi:hypothetical protein